MSVEIALEPSDPRWAAAFASLAVALRGGLGARVLALEHVGSTAVPGLAAKPVIDLVLLVRDSRAEEDYRPALERLGWRFVLREPDWREHRLFRQEAPAANLHVFTDGCPEAARMIAFRDRLRRTPADRARYEALKRALAARTWPSVDAYAAAKGALIEALLATETGGAG